VLARERQDGWAFRVQHTTTELSTFGTPSHMRISFATSNENPQKTMERLIIATTKL